MDSVTITEMLLDLDVEDLAVDKADEDSPGEVVKKIPP